VYLLYPEDEEGVVIVGASAGRPLDRPSPDSPSKGDVIDASDKGEFFAAGGKAAAATKGETCGVVRYCSTGLLAATIPLAVCGTAGECFDDP